jgi:hypothetical protein
VDARAFGRELRAMWGKSIAQRSRRSQRGNWGWGVKRFLVDTGAFGRRMRPWGKASHGVHGGHGEELGFGRERSLVDTGAFGRECALGEKHRTEVTEGIGVAAWTVSHGRQGF